MVDQLPPVPTIGAIANRFGVSVSRVEKIIRSHAIEPVARAGTARVFSLAAVQAIRREIERGGTEGARS